MTTNDTLTGLSGSEDAHQFLTFQIDGEEYGVDILKVREIKGYVATTRLPNSPKELVGVLNLRGMIVPIVDLRSKFNMPPVKYDQFAAIVVVVVGGQVMGMITERVSEVINIPASEIQVSGAESSNAAIQGIGKVGDKLVILLDVDAVLSGCEEAVAA